MATVLDISLISEFSSLFVVVLVFALLFAILEFSKFLGEDNRNLRAIIAFTLAILTLFSPNTIRFILNLGPIFVMGFIMVVFVIMMLKLFGAEDKDFSAALKAKGGMLVYWILGICLVLVIITIGQTFGDDTLRMRDGESSEGTSLDDSLIEQTGGVQDTGQSEFEENVQSALFNPKILGTMLILIIGFFTILLLAGSQTKYT